MPTDFTFVKTNRKFVKLYFDDILLIKGLGNYVEIITTSTEKHIYYKSLKDLIEKLPDEFMRIHNSYIVNLKTIDAYEDNQIIVGEYKVTVGKSYIICLKETLEKYLL